MTDLQTVIGAAYFMPTRKITYQTLFEFVGQATTITGLAKVMGIDPNGLRKALTRVGLLEIIAEQVEQTAKTLSYENSINSHIEAAEQVADAQHDCDDYPDNEAWGNAWSQTFHREMNQRTAHLRSGGCYAA